MIKGIKLFIECLGYALDPQGLARIERKYK